MILNCSQSYVFFVILLDDGFEWLLLLHLLSRWLDHLIMVGSRSDETEHHGKNKKSVVKTEHNNQQEDFEECHEDVGFGASEQNKGQESRESTIKDSRT